MRKNLWATKGIGGGRETEMKMQGKICGQQREWEEGQEQGVDFFSLLFSHVI